MGWKDWLIIVLVALTSGWMLFDGTRALIVGDYITPKSGEYASRLGPWSNLVRAVGIQPHSTLMKLVFVGYGLTTLIFVVCFLLGLTWARTALILTCVLGLWYLPIGTITNLIALILLLIGEQ